MFFNVSQTSTCIAFLKKTFNESLLKTLRWFQVRILIGLNRVIFCSPAHFYNPQLHHLHLHLHVTNKSIFFPTSDSHLIKHSKMFSKKPPTWRVSEKSSPKTYSHKSSPASVCSQRRSATSERSHCRRGRISSRIFRHKLPPLTAQSETTKKLIARRKKPLKITSEPTPTSIWAERRWKSNDTTWHWSAPNRTMPKTNTPINCKRVTSCSCRTFRLHYRQYSTSFKSSTRSGRRASKSS